VCDFHSIAQASALVKHVVLLIQALRMLHHKQLLSNVSLQRKMWYHWRYKYIFTGHGVF